jgi:hypothetical protein
MSNELRIALVAEGPTDYVVIEAALKAILQKPFVMSQLQPEATQPKMGTGWCGVLKWCNESQERQHGASPLQINPILFGFDLVIIHVDIDVATQEYADCGSLVENWANENFWKNLPCKQPCPPVSDTGNALEDVIKSWLGGIKPNHTVFCLPAQSSGTWLASAVLPPSDLLLINAECNLTLESRLEQLPKNQRIKKKLTEYRNHAPRITQQWQQVKQLCSQAANFEQSVLNAI